jgi:uncharacterized membrane protein
MPVERNARFEARLRLAGLLVIAGLAVEVLTLLRAHPVSFIAFLVPGVMLVMAGLVALIWATAAR